MTNSACLSLYILATTASWGSFGSGEHMRACRLNIAVFIVSAGDHWSFRISRQIAPVTEDTFGCHTVCDLKPKKINKHKKNGFENFILNCYKLVREEVCALSRIATLILLRGKTCNTKQMQSKKTKRVIPLVMNFILGGLNG